MNNPEQPNKQETLTTDNPVETVPVATETIPERTNKIIAAIQKHLTGSESQVQTFVKVKNGMKMDAEELRRQPFLRDMRPDLRDAAAGILEGESPSVQQSYLRFLREFEQVHWESAENRSELSIADKQGFKTPADIRAQAVTNPRLKPLADNLARLLENNPEGRAVFERIQLAAREQVARKEQAVKEGMPKQTSPNDRPTQPIASAEAKTLRPEESWGSRLLSFARLVWSTFFKPKSRESKDEKPLAESVKDFNKNSSLAHVDLGTNEIDTGFASGPVTLRISLKHFMDGEARSQIMSHLLKTTASNGGGSIISGVLEMPKLTEIQARRALSELKKVEKITSNANGEHARIGLATERV